MKVFQRKNKVYSRIIGLVLSEHLMIYFTFLFDRYNILFVPYLASSYITHCVSTAADSPPHVFIACVQPPFLIPALCRPPTSLSLELMLLFLSSFAKSSSFRIIFSLVGLHRGYLNPKPGGLGMTGGGPHMR